MLNLPLHIALLLMGFTFTITQVMVIRELLVVFVGNELSIAIILANWLLLEAAGSFFVGKRAEEWGLRERSYALFQLLISILLPLTIYGIRSLRDLMGLSPGEGASLLQILFWTVPLLAPIGITDGILFALGCSLHSKWAREGAASIGKVYLLEAAGAGAGGILYTFFFIPLLGSFQVAFLLGAANLLSGTLLAGFPRKGRRRMWAFPGLLVFLLVVDLFLLTPAVSQWVEKSSLSRLWRGLEVLQSRWSPYGNVTVGRREEQLTFFSNGIPVCNVPVPDIAFAEELVHYPLLLIPSPKNILIIGGGFGGVIHEILKHPVEEVHYAEIDPLVGKLIGENLTPLTRREMENPRVRVHHLDGRLFIRTTSGRFDAILLNLPGPSTLELNRFYTVEFFREVSKRLGKRGVLALTVPGSETYLGPEARDLNLSLLGSLRAVFPSVAVIPGDVHFMIASPDRELGPLTPERLIQSLRAKGIETRFLTPFHVGQKLERQRLEWLEDSLKGEGFVRLNRDMNPSGLYYGIAYWNAQFDPPVQRFWKLAGNLRLWHLGLLLWVPFFWVWACRKVGKGKDRQEALIWIAGTTGFFGTAMSILLIFSFQTLYGYAYQWIGLLVAAFMVGLALGSWLMTRTLGKIYALKRTLMGIEVLILLSITLGIFLLTQFYSSGLETSRFGVIKIGFLIFSILSGLWVGLEFTLSGRIFSGGGERVGRTAGTLYAADLFGAWAGSLVVGVIFVPILGILQTCGAVILLKITSLALVFFLPSESKERETE